MLTTKVKHLDCIQMIFMITSDLNKYNWIISEDLIFLLQIIDYQIILHIFNKNIPFPQQT